MPLYIRDHDVRTMAQRLAEVCDTTVTDAVREAPYPELAGLDAAEVKRDCRLCTLFAIRADDAPSQPWTETDTYDDGIPH